MDVFLRLNALYVSYSESMFLCGSSCELYLYYMYRGYCKGLYFHRYRMDYFYGESNKVAN